MSIVGSFRLPWAPSAGDVGPLWQARDATNGAWVDYDSAPGKPLLLCFPPPGVSLEPLLDGLAASEKDLLRGGVELRCFVRARPAAGRSFPVLLDEDAAIARAFCLPLAERGSGETPSRAVLVDVDGRLLATMPLAVSSVGAKTVVAKALAHAPFSAARPPHAPVLQLPGLLSRALCDELLEAFRTGETVAGTTTEIRDGRALEVVWPHYKLRRDHRLVQPLKDRVWEQLSWRMAPMVRKAFRFDITRYEYLQVGRYLGEEGGHFNAHRDDVQSSNLHRRFALTVNLNDGYEGGELRFHEYGASCRPPAGGGVIFSCSLLHEALPVTRGERFVLVGQFWGEAEVAVRERTRAMSSESPAVRPHVARMSALGESGAALREIAGDVAALGPHLDQGATEIGLRVDALNHQIESLRQELRALRRPFVARQIESLALGGRASGLQLHLGSGQHHMPGWVNIDAWGGELKMDLRWALPFPDGAARYVFASHVVEHFYRNSELPRLLAEVRRVLQPGGVFRVIVPDIEKCLRAYADGDQQFFEDRKKTWEWAARCKTPLDHFLMYAGANQTLENFDGHKYGYDWETLSLALSEAGFSSVARSEFMQSAHAALRVDDQSHNAIASSNGVPYSLFVEATR